MSSSVLNRVRIESTTIVTELVDYYHDLDDVYDVLERFTSKNHICLKPLFTLFKSRWTLQHDFELLKQWYPHKPQKDDTIVSLIYSVSELPDHLIKLMRSECETLVGLIEKLYERISIPKFTNRYYQYTKLDKMTEEFNFLENENVLTQPHVVVITEVLIDIIKKLKSCPFGYEVNRLNLQDLTFQSLSGFVRKSLLELEQVLRILCLLFHKAQIY